jgi:hypothetical protein
MGFFHYINWFILLLRVWIILFWCSRVIILTVGYSNVQDWNKTVHAEQAKTPLTEKPKFTVEDVTAKMAALDRELKYLINKMKSYKPKPKPKPAKEANSTEGSSSNETKTSDGMSA